MGRGRPTTLKEGPKGGILCKFCDTEFGDSSQPANNRRQNVRNACYHGSYDCELNPNRQIRKPRAPKPSSKASKSAKPTAMPSTGPTSDGGQVQESLVAAAVGSTPTSSMTAANENEQEEFSAPPSSLPQSPSQQQVRYHRQQSGDGGQVTDMPLSTVNSTEQSSQPLMEASIFSNQKSTTPNSSIDLITEPIDRIIEVSVNCFDDNGSNENVTEDPLEPMNSPLRFESEGITSFGREGQASQSLLDTEEKDPITPPTTTPIEPEVPPLDNVFETCVENKVQKEKNAVRRKIHTPSPTGTSSSEYGAKHKRQPKTQRKRKEKKCKETCPKRIAEEMFRNAYYTKGFKIPWTTEEVDTVYPSMDDLALGIEHYTTNILQNKLKKHLKWGLVKVVPPPEWKPRSTDYPPTNSIVLTNPQQQNMQRISDKTYSLFNWNFKAMSVEEFKAYTDNLSAFCQDFLIRIWHNGDGSWLKGNAYDRISSMPPPPEDIEVQQAFWDPMRMTSKNQYYGTDVSNTSSLFDDTCKLWNLGKMKSMLDVVQDINKGKPVLGINTSYVYHGSRFSCFPIHIENGDSYSINYLHWGDPKEWYTNLVKDYYGWHIVLAEEYKEEYKCGGAFRHKIFFPTPEIFTKSGYQVGRLVQRKGEFVIAFARGWHFGFNHGVNCAEAVNYATPSWIPLMKTAQYCTKGCEYKDYTINYEEFMKFYNIRLGIPDTGSKIIPKRKRVEDSEDSKSDSDSDYIPDRKGRQSEKNKSSKKQDSRKKINLKIRKTKTTAPPMKKSTINVLPTQSKTLPSNKDPKPTDTKSVANPQPKLRTGLKPKPIIDFGTELLRANKATSYTGRERKSTQNTNFRIPKKVIPINNTPVNLVSEIIVQMNNPVPKQTDYRPS